MYYLLYGLPAGAVERYEEVLLCSVCRTKDDVNRIKLLASRDGFHSFRIVKMSDREYEQPEFPDFTKVFNRKRKR